jgi:hypothetical protein
VKKQDNREAQVRRAALAKAKAKEKMTPEERKCYVKYYEREPPTGC